MVPFFLKMFTLKMGALGKKYFIFFFFLVSFLKPLNAAFKPCVLDCGRFGEMYVMKKLMICYRVCLT